MNNEKIASELVKLAKLLLAEDGSEVDEVEEIEPQGSTPVKERKKKAYDDLEAKNREMAAELLNELRPIEPVLKKAIAELKRAASGKDVTYSDVANFVMGYLRDGKRFSDATYHFFG